MTIFSHNSSSFLHFFLGNILVTHVSSRPVFWPFCNHTDVYITQAVCYTVFFMLFHQVYSCPCTVKLLDCLYSKPITPKVSHCPCKLTLPAPCISKNCIKIKINVNFSFSHFIVVPQRFYEGLKNRKEI